MFLSGLLLLQARKNRRFQKLIARVLAVITVVVLVTLAYIQTPQNTTSLIPNPDSQTHFVPKFVLNFLNSWKSSDPAAQPYDPLKPAQASTLGSSLPENLGLPKLGGGGTNSGLSHNHARILNFVDSQYEGAEKIRWQKSLKLFENVLSTIFEARPRCHKLTEYEGRCKVLRYEEFYKEQLYTEEGLSHYLLVNAAELRIIQDSHEYVMKNLPEKAPEGVYSKDGIVYVGGGKFNWLSLLLIRSLRAAGCQLPVEVLIPTLDEYEYGLCSKILPTMNARCIFLPAALYGNNADAAKRFTFGGFQYKSLAILVLSFENVLLLDSDNMPTYAPDHLFKKEPFKSKGLIVWPDFWFRTTSPDFYRIAGVEISRTHLLPHYSENEGGYNDRGATLDDKEWESVNLHERLGAIPEPSSESGQLMISKKTHMKALLLALYYNSYGPEFYYPLFSQGATGEGDKETFLAATVVLKKPYYQVGKFLDALGNVRHDEFAGHGMGQYDPVADLEYNIQRIKLRRSIKDDEEYKEAISKLEKPKILFVHANFPKLDPWKLKELEETVDKEGKRYRLYGQGMRSRTGTDFEGNVWDHMHRLLCELDLELEHFKNVNRKQLCEEIKLHHNWLLDSANTLE